MKRFIAGAVCPNCRAMDGIYFDQEIGENTIFCVNCDYSDIRATGVSPDDGLPESGVSDKSQKMRSENDSDLLKVTLIDTLESRS